jgi:cytochrome c
MRSFRNRAWTALALAGLIGAGLVGAAAADQQSGREVFERRCQGCHGSTAAAADYPIGPSLDGIIGTQAGTSDAGVHSRAAMDSGIVWDRASLRRFLSSPQREIPGTLMAASVSDPAELEDLLDYLESLN